MTTDQEKIVANLLGDAWNEFCKLPPSHPEDVKEFQRAVNTAQSVIQCRVAQRADPATWPKR